VEIFKTGKTENVIVNFSIKNFNHCKFKFVLMLTKFVTFLLFWTCKQTNFYSTYRA